MNPISFLQEVKAEISKVVWPTRKQAVQLTIMVLVVSAIVGIYIGALDFGFTNLINKLVK